MCGIAGIANLNGEPASPVILKRMTDAIAHRGPDGEGQYVDGAIGLGHRRLAIIDLSPGGRQPMATADGRYTLTYNGEIYNFRELRTELEALGQHFHTRSDSEVLLKAWAQWGEATLGRLNGMFAFALWDRAEKQLILARDRYGIKPIYYAQRGGVFLFASEIKAFTAHPAYRTAINLPGLAEYFTFQNFFTDQTLFEGVRLLPAASVMKVSLAAKSVGVPQKYWDFSFVEPAQPAGEAEYIEELDRLFRQAVNRQLVSDVDVGAYLSGGMDSGSVTALAAKQLPYIKSFTCGFDLNSASGVELGYDERATAEYMSYMFKTEHYEMVLKAGDMERALPRLAWHLEEPRVGQCYPNFYAAQLASKFVKVVLSGAGGDEMFAGYPWRYYRAVVNDDFEHYIDKYYGFWQRLIPGDDFRAVFAPCWPSVQHVSTRDIFRGVFQKHAQHPDAARGLHQPLALLRGQDLPARAAGGRGQAQHGAFAGNARAVPRQRPGGFRDEGAGPAEARQPDRGRAAERERARRQGQPLLRENARRQASAAQGHGTLHPQPDHRAREAGLFGARRKLVQGREHRLRAPQAVQRQRPHLRIPRPQGSAAPGERAPGRQAERRLLIWSLLNVEQWCERFL